VSPGAPGRRHEQFADEYINTTTRSRSGSGPPFSGYIYNVIQGATQLGKVNKQEIL
jgi:hypothetical protein